VKQFLLKLFPNNVTIELNVLVLSWNHELEAICLAEWLSRYSNVGLMDRTLRSLRM